MLNNWRWLFVGAAFACFASVAMAQGAIELKSLPSTVRLRPHEPARGAAQADIAAARGEYVSFQIAVMATGDALQHVSAKASALQNGKQKIDAKSITLYREANVHLRRPSLKATLPPGLMPDGLVPLVDPYTGKPVKGGQIDGTDFDVWQGRHQVLWVDVHVPADAQPGVYKGSVSVQAKGIKAVSLPVQLTVWDFTLPPGPTLSNHFGSVSRIRNYYNLKMDSREYQQLEERFDAMLADNRINPAIPSRYLPSPNDDGGVTFTDAIDKRISDFVNKYHVTNMQIPRAPFSDVLGKDRQKAIRFYRSWYAYLKKKGWADRAYLYMLDEPNTAEAYEKVKKLGELVHEAQPEIRRLVVEQPYTQNPKWVDIDPAVDVWCPLFGFINEQAIQKVKSHGDEVWTYTALVQGPPAYIPDHDQVKGQNPPYWEIDFPLTSYRISPWMAWRYDVTGLLYWSTVYWVNNKSPWCDVAFRGRYNGEGNLMYPGDAAGIDGPIVSMRLKSLRDGMQDYEYFVILKKLGGQATVDRIVRSAVPTWGSWNQSPEILPNLRKQLAREIMRLKK